VKQGFPADQEQDAVDLIVPFDSFRWLVCAASTSKVEEKYKKKIDTKGACDWMLYG
jgi:hypothetical protein